MGVVDGNGDPALGTQGKVMGISSFSRIVDFFQDLSKLGAGVMSTLCKPKPNPCLKPSRREDFKQGLVVGSQRIGIPVSSWDGRSPEQL